MKLEKKILSMILAIAMLVTSFSPAGSVRAEESVRSSETGFTNRESVTENEPGDIELKDHKMKIKMSIRQDGEEVNIEDGKIHDILNMKNAIGKFDLSYSLKEGTFQNTNQKVIYQLPEKIKMVLEEEGGPILDNGQKIGTYTITKSGKVTLEFDNSTVEKNMEGNIIEGKVSFGVSLDNMEIKDNKISEIEFKDGVTIPEISVEGITSQDLNVEKTVISKKNRTALYTVLIKSQKGTENEIILNDTLVDRENGAFVDDLKKEVQSLVRRDKNNQILHTYEDKVFEQDSLKLPALNEGEKYEITYKIDFSNKPKSLRLLNTAEAVSTDSNGNTVKDTSSAEIEFKNTVIKKKGFINRDQNKIEWNIFVQSQGETMNGAILRDIYYDKALQEACLIKVSESDQKKIDDWIKKNPSKGISQSPFMETCNKVSLPYTFSDAEKKSGYIFVVETDVRQNIGDSSAFNYAEIFRDGKKEIGTWGEVALGNVYNPLSKKVVQVKKSEGNYHVKWKIVIDTSQGIIGEDWTFEERPYQAKEKFQVFEKDSESLKKDIEETFKDYIKTDTTIQISENAFVVRNLKRMPRDNKLSFEVDTIVSEEKAEGEEYIINKASINNITAEGRADISQVVRKYDFNDQTKSKKVTSYN